MIIGLTMRKIWSSSRRRLLHHELLPLIINESLIDRCSDVMRIIITHSAQLHHHQIIHPICINAFCNDFVASVDFAIQIDFCPRVDVEPGLASKREIDRHPGGVGVCDGITKILKELAHCLLLRGKRLDPKTRGAALEHGKDMRLPGVFQLYLHPVFGDGW